MIIPKKPGITYSRGEAYRATDEVWNSERYVDGQAQVICYSDFQNTLPKPFTMANRPPPWYMTGLVTFCH